MKKSANVELDIILLKMIELATKKYSDALVAGELGISVERFVKLKQSNPVISQLSAMIRFSLGEKLNETDVPSPALLSSIIEGSRMDADQLNAEYGISREMMESWLSISAVKEELSDGAKQILGNHTI